MSKQTAVEWLMKKMPISILLECHEEFYKAIIMEREQMIDFAQMWQDSPIEKYDCKEDLYNQTYK
jgi:hypothetical protein